YTMTVFAALNIPSIKLFYSSQVINVIILLGTLIIGTVRNLLSKKNRIDKHRFYFLVNFNCLWGVIIFVTAITSTNQLSSDDLLQYFAVIIFINSITIFLRKNDIPYIIKAQVLWGLILSIIHLMFGIN